MAGGRRINRRAFVQQVAFGGAGIAASSWATFGSAASAQPADVPSQAEPMLDLLAISPDLASVPSPPRSIGLFADPLAQFSAFGIPAISGSADPLLDYVPLLPLLLPVEYPNAIRTNLLREDWEITFGFNPFQIEQSLALGDPPDEAVILRGRFDMEAIQVALRLNTYTEMDFGALSGFVIETPDDISPANPARAIWLHGAEYIGIVDERILVFAADPNAIVRVAETITSERASLAVSPDLAPVLSHLGDRPLVTARIARGEALQSPPLRHLANGSANFTDPNSREAMPAPRLVLIGATAGVGKADLQELAAALSEAAEAIPEIQPPAEFPEGLLRIVLTYEDADAATLAAALIDDRLTTGDSALSEHQWTDLFLSWDITADQDVSAVVVELEGTEQHPGIHGLRAFAAHDLGFITP